MNENIFKITKKEIAMLGFMLYTEKKNWTAIGRLENKFHITIASSSDISVDMFNTVMQYIGIPKGKAHEACFDMFSEEGSDFVGLVEKYVIILDNALASRNVRSIKKLT